MTANHDIWFVAIGGLGPDSSQAYRFTTQTPPAAWTGTAYPILLNPPTLPRCKVDPLSSWGSDGTATFSLLYEARVTGAAAPIRKLVGADAQPVYMADGLSLCRITQFVTASAVTLNVNDNTNLSPGFYYIGSECVEVTARPTGTTVTVTRARRGTHASPIPLPAGANLGSVFYANPPISAGYPVTIGRISPAGAETVVFRGILSPEGPKLDSGETVTLTAESAIAVLARKKWNPPIAVSDPENGVELPRGHKSSALDADFIPFDIVGWTADLVVDRDMYGDTEWARCRFVTGDKWVVWDLPTPTTDTLPNGHRSHVYALEAGDPIAHGEGKTVVYFTDPTDARAFTWSVVSGEKVDRVEFMPEFGITLTGLIEGIVTSFGPFGSGAEIHSNFIADITSITGDADLGGTAQGTRDGSFVLPYYAPNTSIKDLLRDLALRAYYLAVVSDTDGKIALLDWATADPPAGTIAASDVLGGYTFVRLNVPPVFIVKLKRGVVQRTIDRNSTTEKEFILPFASQQAPYDVLVSADIVEFGAGILDAALEDRIRWTVIPRYERGCPAIEFMTSYDVAIGGLYTLNRGDAPKADGSRGSSDLTIFVIEAAPAEDRVWSVLALVFDYTTDTVDEANWAPAAIVTAWSAPDATIAANRFTSATGTPSSDAQAWNLLSFGGGESMEVIICDLDGTQIGTATLTGVGANTLELTGATTSPLDKLILPDDYANQTAEAQALPLAWIGRGRWR